MKFNKDTLDALSDCRPASASLNARSNCFGIIVWIASTQQPLVIRQGEAVQRQGRRHKSGYQKTVYNPNYFSLDSDHAHPPVLHTQYHKLQNQRSLSQSYLNNNQSFIQYIYHIIRGFGQFDRMDQLLQLSMLVKGKLYPIFTL
jgi:hypothetical protein